MTPSMPAIHELLARQAEPGPEGHWRTWSIELKTRATVTADEVQTALEDIASHYLSWVGVHVLLEDEGTEDEIL